MANLRKQILDKYRTLTRFSQLTGQSYHKLYSYVESRNPEKRDYIQLLIDQTPDKPVDNELTDVIIGEAAIELAQYDRTAFCRKHGIWNYWIERFLAGEIRYINGRVKRFLGILGVEYEKEKV